MKKIIGFVAVVALMLVAASCGGGNSPKDVAEKAVKCIQNNDYEGYVDLMLITADEGEDLEAKKQAVTGMVQSKAATTLAKMGGIKSYEITSETIAADGKTAEVGMKIVYGNGEEKDDNIKLCKDDKGDWRVDAGK